MSWGELEEGGEIGEGNLWDLLEDLSDDEIVTLDQEYDDLEDYEPEDYE